MKHEPIQIMSKSQARSLAKPKAQVGALPFRIGPDEALEILLVTTRTTGRWTIPKGWPMKGRKGHEAAATEAWEEAGVRGKPGKRPLGRYLYWKRTDTHFVLCRIKLYALPVAKLEEDWPERSERQRAWFSAAEAAQLVEEPGLKLIIEQMARRRQD